MGKSILKFPNFDINMTKFGCSLQVISLPFTSSSSLSIYLQINLHYVSTYSTTSIYGVLYSHSVSIHSIYIFFSLSIPVNSVHCSYIFCIYLSTDLSYCILYLQGSLIYSIYLLCKAIFSALLSTVKMPFYLFYSALQLLCLNIYTEYMYTVTFYFVSAKI